MVLEGGISSVVSGSGGLLRGGTVGRVMAWGTAGMSAGELV